MLHLLTWSYFLLTRVTMLPLTVFCDLLDARLALGLLPRRAFRSARSCECAQSLHVGASIPGLLRISLPFQDACGRRNCHRAGDAI